jgi:hypothetical protein
VARFNDNGISYFYYERAAVVEGDILVATEKGHGFADHIMYRTCILRSVERSTAKNPLTPHNDHWTATPYRIFG